KSIMVYVLNTIESTSLFAERCLKIPKIDDFKTTAAPPKKQWTKPDAVTQRDFYAQYIAEEQQDQESLGCFHVIAQKVPQPVFFEALAAVKDVWKVGKIRKSRGALFVDLI